MKNLTQIDKDIIGRFFCHSQIIESVDDLEILFDVEYLKNKIYQDKFPMYRYVI